MPEPSAERIAVEARIRGRVQGVWFRAWTTQEARLRGLDGWVRNEPDGSVRALFVGSAEMVEVMVRSCHDGPPLARVDAVESREVAPAPELRGFRHQR